MNGSSACRGFTLVEMLVVLVIAGLFVSLITAIVRPDEKGVLRVEADRLAQLFDVAAAEARVTGKPVAWTADAAGYRFWRWREGAGWAQTDTTETLRRRSLPEGLTISGLWVENTRAQGDMRLEFVAYDPALSYVVQMSMGSHTYAVVGSPIGDVRVDTNEETADVQAAQR